jgi:hypothetical protein
LISPDLRLATARDGDDPIIAHQARATLHADVADLVPDRPG